MKTTMMLLIGILVLPTLMTGCIVAPLDDGYYRDRYDYDYGRRDGHRHGHHDHHGRRGGWYDGRR